MELEALLCSRDGFGLESASFLQRASCRITDGADLADLVARASDFERRCLETAIGCSPTLLPVGTPPVEVYNLNPIRTGKSLAMAALAVARSQMIDVSIIKPGEAGPRITILSTETDNANALRAHLGIVNERPMLASLKVGETAESVYMRHPSGLTTEIAVAAAKRGGLSLASRFSGTVLFDEAPGWYSTDKIVSLEESRDQALGRLLPGAQLYYGGSKWQPSGHCYSVHRDSFGRPTSDVVVVSAQEVDGVSPARQLNPVFWTPEREAKVQKASRRAYAMNVLNNFGGSESAVLSFDELQPCISLALEGYGYGQAFCGLDASKLRRDGFAFCIGFFAEPLEKYRQKWVMINGHPAMPELDKWGRPIYHEAGKTLLRIGEIGGWSGSEIKKVTIEQVVAHIVQRCNAWGADLIVADDFESTALAGHFSQHGKTYKPYAWSERSKDAAIGGTLKRYVREQILSLAPHSEMERELLSIRQIPKAGDTRWSYPTNGLDYASSVIAIMHALNDGELLNLPKKHTKLRGVPHQPRRGSRREVDRGDR